MPGTASPAALGFREQAERSRGNVALDDVAAASRGVAA